MEKFVAPEGSFTFAGYLQEGTTFRSIDEFLRFRAAWMEPYDEFDYEPTNFLGAEGNRVLVLFHQRGRLHGTDVWVEMDYGILYTVEKGLLSGAVIYEDPDEALEAAGLSE